MKIISLSILLIFSSLTSFSYALTPDAVGVIENLLGKWRSNDRYIDGGTLREESELFIPVAIRKQLAESRQAKIVQALQNEALKKDWSLTTADAENILKIRKITQLTLKGHRPFANVDGRVHGFQNEIVGLPQNRIDEILRPLNLPEVSKNRSVRKTEHPFSYVFHKLKAMAFKSGNSTLIDNDLYAFTVAAVFYNLGWHKSKEAVFDTSTRGADQYPFMVSAGQDQVLDVLEGGRFTRWDIEKIRNFLEPRMHVDPGFYNWLANWRFRGTVRSMPVGTLVFPETSIVQVIADPASSIIVESLINPWISYMSNMATTAARIKIAAGKIKVTEAGTRRLVTGNLSALTALMGGAEGTSNVLIAALTGATAYGTMSHASVAMFPTEFEAFEAFSETAKKPTLLLPDTHHLPTGIRTGIRAGGDKVGNFRQDSNIVEADGTPLTTAATILRIRDDFKNLGKGHWAGVVTNDLTEKTLRELATSGLDIEVASIGGAFAASSVGVAHGNMVYKLVEMRDIDENSKDQSKTKSKRYPIKIANGVKSTEPSEKDVYRISDARTGLYLEDRKVPAGSGFTPSLGQTATHLSPVTMSRGRRVSPRVGILEADNYIGDQVTHLAPALVDLIATRKSLADQNYRVVSSPELLQIRREAIEAVLPKKELRVLVISAVLDEVSTIDREIENARRVNELFKNQVSPEGFDHIIFVASENDHPSNVRLNRSAQIEQLRRRVQGLANASVYSLQGESSNANAVINTLAAIQQLYPSAKLKLALKEKDFWSIGQSGVKWKDADQLLSNYGIVVVKENSQQHFEGEYETRMLLQHLGFEDRPNGFLGPLGRTTDLVNHRIEFFRPNTNAAAVSSQQINEFYDDQGFAALAHATDPMWTFAMRALNPSHDQGINGALAVAGSEHTIAAIVRIIKVAVESGLMKFSISSDAHLPVEVQDASQNGEFHAPSNFPEHGMKGRPGPDGDRFLTEVEEILEKRDVLIVPGRHEVVENGHTSLVLTPFDLTTPEHKPSMTDIHKILHFQKNGVGAHTVTSNPRYEEYLKFVDPYKVLPHFHFGWCTDFCDYQVLRRELELGYNVIFIADAAAGVGKKTTGQAMRTLIAQGLKVMSSAEFFELNDKWQAERANWSTVLNDLAIWEQQSDSKARVEDQIAGPLYVDPSHPGDLGESCALLLMESHSQ
jgi:nicotinate phosphoribosyltransferase